MRSNLSYIGGRQFWAAAATACLALGLEGTAGGAVVTLSNANPTYNVAFNNPPADIQDFVPGTQEAGGTTDTWTETSGAWQHQFSAGSYSSNVSSQTVQTSGVVGNNFTLSTNFNITSASLALPLIPGLSVLASSPTQGDFNTGGNWYAGVLRVSSSGDGLLDLGVNASSYYSSLTGGGNGQDVGFAIQTGTTYAMSVSGTYDPSGDLTLSTTLTNTANPSQTYTVTAPSISSANAYTGTYFGYREEAFASNTTLDYSNFSLSLATASVPEPASVSVLGLGAIALLSRRRRFVK